MARAALAVGLLLAGVAVGVLATLAMLHVRDDGNGAEPERTPRAGVVTVRIEEDGSCSSEGPQTVSFQKYAIEFLKEGDDEVWVHVLRPAGGVTFEELAAHVAEDHERIAGGDQPVGYEDLAGLEVSIPVADDRKLFRDGWGDVEPGTLGFLCERWNSLSLAGPLEVVR